MNHVRHRLIGIDPKTGIASYQFANSNPIGYVITESSESRLVEIRVDDGYYGGSFRSSYKSYRWDGMSPDDNLADVAVTPKSVFDEIGNFGDVT